MNPLGKYGQAVAAAIAVVIIAAYLGALVFGAQLGVDAESIGRLEILALIVVGAIFGSVATINGVKAPLDAAHNRIDKLETATGIPTHGTYVTASEVAELETARAIALERIRPDPDPLSPPPGTH